VHPHHRLRPVSRRPLQSDDAAGEAADNNCAGRPSTTLSSPATFFMSLTRPSTANCPSLIARLRPTRLLMFGLADRTAFMRIETRAPQCRDDDVPRCRPANRARQGSIVDGAGAARFGPHTAKLLSAARGTRHRWTAGHRGGRTTPAATSGNYLSWRYDRGGPEKRRPAACRVCPYPTACARRLVAAKGRLPSHHAGRPGRRRRSGAAGDGEADARDEAADGVSSRGISKGIPIQFSKSHSPLSSPGLTGRSSIPEALVLVQRGRGVLDAPLEAGA